MSGYRRYLTALLKLMIFAAFALGTASADESNPEGRLYAPSSDAVGDVRQALAAAAGNNRKALVVMGANWCHDSRALAARLQQSPLSDVVSQNYELVFVDVGFLAKGRSVLDELEVAQFYSTPTVLVVDPDSGKVINNEDRHIWGNAYNIDMDSSVDYFEKWAASEAPAEDSAELQKLYAEIDRFERQLAERVAMGYAYVGPKLAARVAGNSPADYQVSWDALRDFRMAIPKDILALREEAERRVAAGETDVQLTYPDYPPLAWELN